MFSWGTELSYETGFPSIKEMSTYLNSALQMFCLTLDNHKLKVYGQHCCKFALSAGLG